MEGTMTRDVLTTDLLNFGYPIGFATFGSPFHPTIARSLALCSPPCSVLVG